MSDPREMRHDVRGSAQRRLRPGLPARRSAASRHLVLYAFPRRTERQERTARTASARGSASRSAGGSAARWSATASSACCARPSGRWRTSCRTDHDFVVVARGRARRAARSATGSTGCRARSAGAARPARLARRTGRRRATPGGARHEARHRGRCSAPIAALPAVDLARAPAPLQVRADLLGLCASRRCARTAPLRGHRARGLAAAALQPVQPRRAMTRSSAPAALFAARGD